ncbi:hypothetical protein D3C86_1988750 [compost metagenome]
MHKANAQQRMILKDRHHFFHVGFGIEQADDISITPQTGFAWQRLKHRCVMRILESNGN